MMGEGPMLDGIDPVSIQNGAHHPRWKALCISLSTSLPPIYTFGQKIMLAICSAREYHGNLSSSSKQLPQAEDVEALFCAIWQPFKLSDLSTSTERFELGQRRTR